MQFKSPLAHSIFGHWVYCISGADHLDYCSSQRDQPVVYGCVVNDIVEVLDLSTLDIVNVTTQLGAPRGIVVGSPARIVRSLVRCRRFVRHARPDSLGCRTVWG